jgi:formate-dependent nitrite reductase membrane component NrfD
LLLFFKKEVLPFFFPDGQRDMREPDEKPLLPQSAHDTMDGKGAWSGPTYYGRSQLKPAPFENWVVGGYIFLAGVSGSSALLSAIAETMRGRKAGGMARRGRYLSLLAPTIGSALLVYDLHTPKRFYNMLRIAKKTSPMSIGTWILMGFSGFAMLAAGAQLAADIAPKRRWLSRIASLAHLPAGLAGMGLSTYTAALLSATSTPLWAAAPRWMAVRFGSSSVASGAAALSLGERSPRNRRALDAIAVAALSAELAATMASHRTYERTGVAGALQGKWGVAEKLGATGLGVILPLGLQAATLALSRRRPGPVSDAACLAVLFGSLLLRVSMMSAGDTSASDPNISFRFSQPENLPPTG